MGGGGEYKVTKGYLSETFECSIFEMASVTFGVQWRGRSKVTKALSFQNVQMFGL